MCVILIGKAKHIRALSLADAWATNPHGAGVLIPAQEPIVFKGLMTLVDLKTVMDDLPADTLTAVHLRLATHGSVSKENTHPFKVGRKSHLMHNGVLTGLGKSGTGHDTVSDSGHLAQILAQLKGADRHALLNTLGGKFAYVYKHIIYTFGHFETYKKVAMSNTYWQVKSYSGFSNYKGKGERWRNGVCYPCNDDSIAPTYGKDKDSPIIETVFPKHTPLVISDDDTKYSSDFAARLHQAYIEGVIGKEDTFDDVALFEDAGLVVPKT